MHELAIRIHSDYLPSATIDAVYLVGQTSDNQESVFAAGQEVFNAKLAGQVLILGAEARCGYPGGRAWREALVQRGLPDSCIKEVPAPQDGPLNTLTESQAVIAYADKYGLRSLAITAAPFHQLRAFITMISVTLDTGSPVKLYSQPGAPLPWHEIARHSQGEVSGTRLEILAGELERIRIYQAKGDLVSEQNILEYLKQRDLA